MKTNRQNKKIEADQRGQLLPRLPCKHQQHGASQLNILPVFFFVEQGVMAHWAKHLWTRTKCLFCHAVW